MNTKERTLVLLKPDAVQRNLVGEIVGRFERAGLKIVAMKFLLPTAEQAHAHYVKNEAEIEALGRRMIMPLESAVWQEFFKREAKKKGGAVVNDDPKEFGQKIIDRLIVFLTSSPVLAIVLEGNKAIPIVRKLLGSTEPLQSDVGTIRGDYTLDSYELADAGNRAVRNLVHASANDFDAEYEIKIWFKKDELVNYRTARERILYDVNLDNILE